jgi:glycosyltransferase involved in cell wall biosynthesis
LRRLLETEGVAADAVVPVPRCPPFDWFLHQYREQRKAPRTETRFGVSVRYPRFPTWPIIGRWLNPLLMAIATRRTVGRVLREHPDVAVIDAHFVFPDGVAAALLGGWFGRPVVITARGSDINVMPRSAAARRWIRWATRRCAAIVAVSQALAESMIGLGVERDKVYVVRNGVDFSIFAAMDREAARHALGIAGTTLLSVGNLVPEKGHQYVIAALRDLPGASLIVIGQGPYESSLRRLATELGVATRIRWAAVLPQSELARYYAAADVTVLMSRREGTPNVLLESMACGTPVVATGVGGVPEIVIGKDAGLIVREHTSAGLVTALKALLKDPPSPAATRAYAQRFDWQPTTHALMELYRTVTQAQSGALAAHAEH